MVIGLSPLLWGVVAVCNGEGTFSSVLLADTYKVFISRQGQWGHLPCSVVNFNVTSTYQFIFDNEDKGDYTEITKAEVFSEDLLISEATYLARLNDIFEIDIIIVYVIWALMIGASVHLASREIRVYNKLLKEEKLESETN